ncbi:MAG: sugar transferase, partial [Eubacteriales bacterium]|nr:sugar transferase [Eubacteriales bacterium]
RGRRRGAQNRKTTPGGGEALTKGESIDMYMDKTKESVQNVVLFITDAASIVAGYYMAGVIWLAIYKGLGINTALLQLSDNIVNVIVALFLTMLFYSSEQDFLNIGKFEELKSVFVKAGIYSIIIAVYELLKKDAKSFSRGIYVLTFFLAVLLMFCLRIAVKNHLRKSNVRGRAIRIVMVTLKDRAKPMISMFQKKNDWMRRLEGIVIMDGDMTGQQIGGFPVVANRHTMMTFIKNEVVDEVYIDVSYHIREEIKPLVMELEDMGVTVHLKIEMLDSYRDFDASLGYLGDIPVVTFANRMYDWKSMALKRALDICSAVAGLIIMGIAMIFVAPAIKLESKGPLFFKQKRVGKNGRYFEIYKFRSMYIDAEERKKELMAHNEMSGLMFKMKDDPRITKVGKFIRKTSIDELPQFINVLKGDMSLIGTRPPTVGEFKQYAGHHKRRLSMKPGITGMWQAYGRNTVDDFEEVVKMDLDYIDHWSMLLDIKILCKTFVTVFTTGGK